MLNNKMEKNGSSGLNVFLEGRLETVTAPQVERSTEFSWYLYG